MFVKPVAGRKVPDPVRGDLLPAEGREVEPQQYWDRRIDDGDVIEVAPVVDTPTRTAKSEQ